MVWKSCSDASEVFGGKNSKENVVGCAAKISWICTVHGSYLFVKQDPRSRKQPNPAGFRLGPGFSPHEHRLDPQLAVLPDAQPHGRVPLRRRLRAFGHEILLDAEEDPPAFRATDDRDLAPA